MLLTKQLRWELHVCMDELMCAWDECLAHVLSDQQLHAATLLPPVPQVERQAGGCQVPDDLYTSSSSSSKTQQQQQQSGAQSSRAALPTDLLLGADPALAEFIEWAVPQVLFELQRAEAEAAANSSLASAAAGPAFGAVQTALNSSSGASMPALLAGELQLAVGSSLLAGRPVVGLSGPPTLQAAATAAAAVSAAVGSTVSNHLLLSCYGPVPLAAVSEHGLAGLGCLCVWDLLLLAAGSSAGQGQGAGAVEAAGGSVPHGVVQLLVSEGRPTCCCWGAGEAATLVFAGTVKASCWSCSGVFCCAA
jgi:hypothetical protein